MRGRALAAATVVAFSFVGGFQPLSSAAASRPARHSFRLLPVLATVPLLPKANGASASDSALTQAVKACDLARVTAAVASGAAIPTTVIREVGPSQCMVLPERDGQLSRLLLAPLAADAALGTPAGLSGRDVRAARSVFQNGAGNAVDFTLTTAGAAKFNALAAVSFARSRPRNEVAVVIDALVYAAAVFQTASFHGPIQFTGNFTAGQARSLAASINASRRSG
jgi:preprotein translocase subunit SecD